MFKDYIERLKDTLDKTQYYRETSVLNIYEDAMREIVDVFFQIKREGKNLFFIGNGGSAAIASHMTSDFMKNGGMNTYSLYDASLTTCMGNDYSYDYIFSKPLGFLLKKHDLLVAISSSGNSENIVKAIHTAKEKGAVIITFSGFGSDNKIKSMGDYNVYIPLGEYGIVESIHNLILQQIVDTILAKDGVGL
ncbi:SIS domain-containing protein [Lachnospiraceae bacterium ZAX-1]